MSRNDGFMYSGITSSTNERRQAAKQVREEKADAKREARGKLLPAADVVFAEIDNEKRKTYEKLAKLPLGINATNERVLARLEAVQMHIDFLDRFNTSMQNKLRTSRKTKDEDSDDE